MFWKRDALKQGYTKIVIKITKQKRTETAKIH